MPAASGSSRDAGVPLGVAAGAVPAAVPADDGAARIESSSGDGDAGTAEASSSGGLAPPTVAPSVVAMPMVRKMAPPLPPPTPAQLDALQALQAETDAYEKGAREYRDTVTTIVQLHYEEKKKEILSGLDSEIATEKGGA